VLVKDLSSSYELYLSVIEELPDRITGSSNSELMYEQFLGNKVNSLFPFQVLISVKSSADGTDTSFLGSKEEITFHCQ
jgi:hypothetical protein